MKVRCIIKAEGFTEGKIYVVQSKVNNSYIMKNDYDKNVAALCKLFEETTQIGLDVLDVTPHYNGWKILDDHIEQFGVKSGYEMLIFNIRKYSERAHKKGQLQSDLDKIISYATKAKELADKHDIEGLYK